MHCSRRTSDNFYILFCIAGHMWTEQNMNHRISSFCHSVSAHLVMIANVSWNMQKTGSGTVPTRGYTPSTGVRALPVTLSPMNQNFSPPPMNHTPEPNASEYPNMSQRQVTQHVMANDCIDAESALPVFSWFVVQESRVSVH